MLTKRTITGLLAVCLCIVVLIAIVNHFAPHTHTVPDDFNSIQAAVDAAREGDTVLIKPGTYSETVKFKSGITLRGQRTDTNNVMIENYI